LKGIHRHGSYQFLEVESNPWSSKAKFLSHLTLLDKKKRKDGGSSKTCLKHESLKEFESEHSKGPFSEFKFNRKL
jgi:hypothetical protein